MATFIYSPLLLLTLHTAAILLPLAGGVLAASPQILLAGRSFSLSATLDITNNQNHDAPREPDEPTTWRYHLDELHSAWQLRSKVRYRLAGGELRKSQIDTDELIGNLPVQVRESGTFFADQEQLLVMNEAERYCEAPASGRELVERLFTDDLLAGFAHEKHLIGAGRLLLFVNANREKFERRGSSDEYTATLQVSHAQGANFEVTVRYSAEQESRVEKWAGIPQSITIERKSNGGGGGRRARVYRFTFERYYELTPAGRPLFGPLEATASLHWAAPIAGGDRDQHGQALAFDLFALERTIGCSRVMAAPQTAPLDMTRSEPHGFTLTARFDLQMVDEPILLAVGYEPALYTLKVRKEQATRTTEMLTNFRQNRCYYSTSRRAGAAKADLVLDSILQVGGGAQVESTCVVARASLRRDTSAADAEDPRDASARETAVSPYTQGLLLLGADRLVYMGMARVRGIDANVYESYDSQLPVWLQAPAVYQAAGGDQLHLRANSLDGDRAPALLTSVFYFSRHGRSSDHLLLVEIFKSPRPDLDAKSAAAVALRKDKITIPIYDFAWRKSGEQGGALASNGARLEDFHSLGGDQCLAAATRARNQYARLDLLLESLDSSDRAAGPVGMVPDWLLEPGKRNLALMRALQEQFNVPSQFVYDLNSRYETTRTGAKVLPVTLHLAQREETRSDLHLLGRGQFRLEIRPKFRMFLAYSFQGCNMIAAQRKSNLTLFLFDPIRSMCYLYKGDTKQLPGVDDDDDDKLLQFLLSTDAHGGGLGSLEAYKIVQRLDIAIPSRGKNGKTDPRTGSGQTIEQLRERVGTAGSLYLTDPSSEPPPVSGEEWAPAKSHFKLAKFAIELVDPKSVAQLSDDKSGQLVESDSNKFPGFGLVARIGSDGDEQTRAVYAKWVPSPTVGELPGQMTYEQCQTACLASAECRAYSTCILDGQIRCLISSVSFRSVDLVAQLMMLERMPAKVGAIYALNLSSDAPDEIPSQSEAARQVHVMRHPSCELHNKSYRDLFMELGRRVSLSLAGRILRPVSSTEQCARLCFNSTWEFIRDTVSNGSSRMDEHIRRKSTQEAIAEPLKWAREYRERICDHFLYLDLDQVKQLGGGVAGPSALDTLKAHVEGLNFEGPTRGYCIMDKLLEQTARTTAAAAVARGEEEKQVSNPEVGQQVIEGWQFEFNFLALYEATQGLSLSESPKSDLEKAAYYSVSYGRAATPEELRAISLFLDRGDNSGQAQPADSAAQCARECFQQLTGPTPWPACKSFSYMEVWHNGRGKRYSFCLYNSITLRQAHAQERFDLVRDRPETQDRICVLESEQVRIWHYDPKPGLVAGSLDQVYHMSLDQMETAAHSASSTGVHLGPLGLCLSLALCLGLGVPLGVWLGNECHLRKMVGLQANGRPSDADQLVTGGAARRSRPAKVVFENAHHRAAVS